MTSPTIEERIAHVKGDLNHLATKADIADLRGELKTEIAELKGSFRFFLIVLGVRYQLSIRSFL